MTTRLYVVCVNVRDGKDFGVRMAPDEYIGELKERINERKKYTQNADDLKLYLAKAQGNDRWLAADDPAVRNLRHNVVSDEIQELLCDDLKLQAGKRIDNLFQGAPNADVIHVLVVPPAPDFGLGVDCVHTTAWAPYVDATKYLVDDPQVLRLVGELERVTTIEPTPFVVLENSSGTGKTQMAFNLSETGRCEVFYVTCDDVKGDVQQPVYEAVRTRSAAFRLCADKDKDILDQGSILGLKDTPRLYLYALIAAALDGRTKFTSPASRLDVENAIKRRQERNGKPMVFSLTNFHAWDPVSEQSMSIRFGCLERRNSEPCATSFDPSLCVLY